MIPKGHDTPKFPQTLFLARHAQSFDPTVFHGFESDIPLGAHGVAQALAFSQRPDLAEVDLLVSSGQLRSLQTLEPFAKNRGLEIHRIAGFHERRVGILQGTPVSSSASLFSQTRREWALGNKDHTTEGAESYTQVRNRVLEAMTQLLDLCNHLGARQPLVVSHGLTMKILLMERLFEGDASRWDELGPIENTALWAIDNPQQSLWEPRIQGCLQHLDQNPLV